MKKMNKKTLGIVAVAVVALGLLAIPGLKKSPEDLVDVASLSKGELVNSINISGIVKSDEAQSVYAKENLLVKEIKVEVGDKVKKGDVLAILDTESIEKDLEKAKVNLASTLKNIENDQQNIETNVASAEKSVEGARLTLEKQTLNYETIKKEYEAGTNTEITNAKGALERAEIDLQTSEKDYKNAKDLLDLDLIAKSEYEAHENTYKNAVINHTNATESYKKAKENLEKNYKQAGIDLDTAKNSYETAKINLTAAKQKNTDAYTYTIEQQEIEIRKIEDRINNATIVAPVDGTVTVSNIEVGQMPNGTLFEIENMDQLVVTTYIKEYDIASVEIGQTVTLKSDGTKNEVINGVVSYIAPTTRKDAASNNEFEVEVSITDANTGLKVGMETRMNIILEKKSDIFYVAYDTVLTNQEGEEVVYTVVDETVQEVVVHPGMESDVYMEIEGEALYEGMPILINPTGYTPGEKVKTE